MIIRHILADGREVDDVTGYLLTAENKDFYKIMKKVNENEQKEIQKNN